MQYLRLHIARDLQRLRQKIRVACGGLFHFTPLHLSVRRWNFFHSFELVLIRNAKHWSDKILFPAHDEVISATASLRRCKRSLSTPVIIARGINNTNTSAPTPSNLMMVLWRRPNDG